jgi:tetratricopeptide (TPR) repeat protein
LTPAPSDPARLVKELDELVDQVMEIGGSLELPEEPEDFEPWPVQDESQAHRQRARLALLMISIRDRCERLIELLSEGGAPAPKDLDALLPRVLTVMCLLDKVDEAKAFHESFCRLLPPEKSAWYMADGAATVINALLAQDRFDEAVGLYRDSLHLNRWEEAAVALVRGAFFLVSRLVMAENMPLAAEVYHTMERFGGGRINLTLVDPSPGSASSAAGGRTVPAPDLRLLAHPDGSDPAAQGPGRDLADQDYIGIVRAQAAVNIISGYAMNGQTGRALEVFRSMPDPADPEEYVNLRSMASVNLVCAYIRNRRWERAIEVLESLRELGRERDNSLYQAKAVVEIIGYTQKERLGEAIALYESLEGVGEGPEFELERMRAAGNIVYAAGEHGQLELARSFYDSLGAFGDCDEALMVRAAATINLMSDYCAGAMVAEAEELFGILEGLRDLPELMETKAQGAFNLMCCYIRKGRFKLAEELYRRIRTYGDSPRVTMTLAHATFGLVTEYLKLDKLDEALAVYRDFALFPEGLAYDLERAKAMCNLVQYCGGKGLRTMATRFFREVLDSYVRERCRTRAQIEADPDPKAEILRYFEFNGEVFGLQRREGETVRDKSDDELCELVSDAGYILVSHYVQEGIFDEATALLRNLNMLAELKPVRTVVQNALQACFETVIFMMGHDRLKEAVALFFSFDAFPAKPGHKAMVADKMIRSGLHIIEHSRSLPDIRLLFDRLTRDAANSSYAHFLGRAALRYGELSCEAGDYAEARRVHGLLATFGDTKRINLYRLQLGVRLLEYYYKIGDRDSAVGLFDSIKSVGGSRHGDRLHGQAAKIIEKLNAIHSGVVAGKARLEPHKSVPKGRAQDGARSGRPGSRSPDGTNKPKG